MSEWILSLVGVILLGVLLEIVMPEGKTAKYVRGAFSLLIVFAIAAPLPALLSKDAALPSYGDEVRVDENYVAQTYADYELRLEAALDKYLASKDMEAKTDVSIEDGEVARVSIKLYRGDVGAAMAAVRERLNIDEARVEAAQV